MRLYKQRQAHPGALGSADFFGTVSGQGASKVELPLVLSSHRRTSDKAMRC